jgi:hypothetical protein
MYYKPKYVTWSATSFMNLCSFTNKNWIMTFSSSCRLFKNGKTKCAFPALLKELWYKHVDTALVASSNITKNKLKVLFSFLNYCEFYLPTYQYDIITVSNVPGSSMNWKMSSTRWCWPSSWAAPAPFVSSYSKSQWWVECVKINLNPLS